MASDIVSVEDLSSHIRSLLERDALLQDVWVEGEVSSFTIASSGHAYLTLQQGNARIDGVMWRAIVGRQRFIPRVGDNIVSHGRITIYERQGKYQLAADVFQPAGIGILQLRLEQLRQKLEAEGLFDPARKRELPLFPRRIGVATSATGAVWHDIQTVIGRRFPLAELVLAPTLVQGDGAPDAIVSALALLQGEPDLDLIILARGGGSMEDLWCFNDERVARAIFASRYPVISAIGHETDVTIADYVADVRAPTPSAAAELAVPSREELLGFIAGMTVHAATRTQQRIDTAGTQLSTLVHRLERTSPRNQLAQQRAAIDVIATRIAGATAHTIERRTAEIERTASVLASLNPVSILERGYALVVNGETRQPVSSVHQLAPGTMLETVLRDGTVTSTVAATTPSRH
ncbi:MAG: exodeoxyribonuclease VII large subunit [Thermomicrobiales bacterium]